jgi:hypothetical protein
MTDRPRLRRGDAWPSLQQFASAISDELVGSWTGESVRPRKSGQAQLRREKRRIEDRRAALIDQEIELDERLKGAYGDDVDLEDLDDDVFDDDVENVAEVEVEPVVPLPDHEVDAAKQPYDEAFLAAMSREQRAYFEQGSS